MDAWLVLHELRFFYDFPKSLAIKVAEGSESSSRR